MNKQINLIVFVFFTLVSCNHSATKDVVLQKPTITQQALLDEGWIFVIPKEDMSEMYGFDSKFGIQDNYFDITNYSGYSMAIKIMDTKDDRCIRYVYVLENSTTTVPEIPQGVYYLKLAYGDDWMELDADGIRIGKFTNNVFYEKSQGTFDFGTKNSMETYNYCLKINVGDSKLENNFLTQSISEEEFLK